MAASRLQRWSVYLSNFNFKIKHLAGKDNGCADALSRLSDADIKVSEVDDDFSYLNFVASEFQRPINSLDIAKQTEIDPILKTVLKYVKHGWPDNVKYDGVLKNYYIRRNELTLEQNVILWGHRIVVPEKFRIQLLAEMHCTHQGIVRLKSIARSFFWWPCMDSDLENYIKGCEVCKINQKDPKRSEVNPWPKTNAPLERIHLDFCGPINNIYYLVLVDSFTKWLEVVPMKGMTAQELIVNVKKIFLTIGVPLLIVSDNGTSFVSLEF